MKKNSTCLWVANDKKFEQKIAVEKIRLNIPQKQWYNLLLCGLLHRSEQRKCNWLTKIKAIQNQIKKQKADSIEPSSKEEDRPAVDVIGRRVRALSLVP